MMQPDELKAARKALGMSQQEMADAMGVSRVLIGQMERGQAPIERRTELALEALTEKMALLRVTVGRFGKKFVVIATEKGSGGPARVHHVRSPAYDTLDEAHTAGRALANESGCEFRPMPDA